MQLAPPSPLLFSALLSGNTCDILGSSEDDLRPFLPSLVRMVLCPVQTSEVCVASMTAGVVSEGIRQGLDEDRRKLIHTLIAGIMEVNAIRSYLELNFQELRHDALKEQQLLRKLGSEDRGQSILVSSLQFGLAIEFERSNFLRRFRLFLSEIFKVLSQLDSSGPFKLVQSDLFECDAHLEEICDIMCVATAELPSLLPILQLSEALLRLRNGPHLLTRVLANMPDSFDQVVTSLVLNGETLDEVSLAGRCRTGAIHMLCHMQPTRAAYVQGLAVQNCKHPTLALILALEAEKERVRLHSQGMQSEHAVRPILHPNWASGQAGVVTLLHNIIITGDEPTRMWFTQYLKCMQQKYRRHKHSAVTKLRSYILNKLRSFNYISTPKTFSPLDPLFSLSQPKEVNVHEETMETESSLVIESNQETSTGHVILDKESVEEVESVVSVAVSSSSETLEELVDQMEIEISDHEGDMEDKENGSEDEDGVPKLIGVASNLGGGTISVEEAGGGGGGGVEKVKLDGEVLGEKIETSTRIVTGRGDSGGDGEEGERVVSRVRVSGEEGCVVGGRRRRQSSTHDRTEFLPISLHRQLSNEDILELMALLQVCCALKTQTQMYLKEEEAGAILSHIVCTCPPFSPAGVHFIEVTLCVMLACPFLISIDGCEGAVLKWFQWLLEKLPVFDQACEGGLCSYGELLLLISIHLREKQLDQIEELIATTLSMKASSSLRSGHFTTLTRLFLKVFTEEVVSSHAVSVPPTRGLSAEMKGYLPIHCIHQLIKMRNFRKYNISIKDWIYRQLLVVSEPLHSSFPLLLQEFVNSILVSAITSLPRSSYVAGGKASTKNHTPFTADEVLSVFKRDPATYESHYPLPAQLLMLYYVLLYQDCYLTNLRALLVLPVDSAPSGYSPNVLTQIPVKYLLDHAHLYQGRYSTLYPTLLKLMATQFPQLCLVCEWLTEQQEMSGIAAFDQGKAIRISKKNLTPETAMKVLQEVHVRPSQAVVLLHYLCSLPPTSLVPYAHAITSTLVLLLHSPSVSQAAKMHYVTLWTKLNTIIPRKLWLATVNALRPKQLQSVSPYSNQDIARDPLTLLHCDPRVFRCPPIFDLLLRCLASYMATAKTFLHEQAHVQNCMALARPDAAGSHVTKQEREEMCIALNATQESTMIQLLLEVCISTDQDKELESRFGSQLSALREVHCLVCSFLHHTFIAEPNLAKLVHFQGYPPELIPMMVSGIPSMHICLGFIPELLAQPYTDKQVFGVQLAAHVIHQYPVPEAMGIAKDILQRLTVLAAELPQPIRDDYFTAVLPSLSLLCRTFPPLCSEATEFLVHLTKICQPFGSSSKARVVSSGGGAVPLVSAIEDTFSELVAFITA